MKVEVIFICIIMLLVSCNTSKYNVFCSDDVNIAVINSISDYIKTDEYNRVKDSISFNVRVSEEKDEYRISISPADHMIYPAYGDSIGCEHSVSIPTRYVIINNKLFYWLDKNKKITKELIDVFLKYNAIDLYWRDREYNTPLGIPDGKYPEIYFPPISFNDGLRFVIYKVPKNKFSNYKRYKNHWN